MAKVLFSNGASSLLAASLNPGDTVIQVTAGVGQRFPSPGAGEYFVLAIENANGAIEYCHCTSRAVDLLTVIRGQESTSAQSWTVGQARVELRNTAGQMGAMLQKAGDAMTGDLDMDGNEVQDAVLTGDTKVMGGQTVATAIRGALDDASNELFVPPDGSRALAGGSPIVVLGDNLMTLMPVGALIMWYGSLGSLPAGWQLCNGMNGSPDLRDFFPRGAGGSLTLGAAGGSASAGGTTDPAGGVAAGVTGSTALTEAQIPAHKHLHGIPQHRAEPYTGNDPFPPGETSGNSNYDRAAGEGVTPLPRRYTLNTGGGAGHEHTTSAVVDHSHTLGAIATVPPYKAVYFIMKVA